MATTVRTHDFNSNRGRPFIYPWKEWFDGRVWKLQHGKDFTANPVSFAMAAYQRAHRSGGRVRVDKTSEPGFVFLQFGVTNGK